MDMASNPDGSIRAAFPANNIRVGVDGAITYASSNTTVNSTGSGVYQTASTTQNTVTQVSAAVSNRTAAQSLVAGGVVVIYPGIWTNDAAAATGGVPVGGLYKRSDGLVAFRQS